MRGQGQGGESSQPDFNPPHQLKFTSTDTQYLQLLFKQIPGGVWPFKNQVPLWLRGCVPWAWPGSAPAGVSEIRDQ